MLHLTICHQFPQTSRDTNNPGNLSTFLLLLRTVNILGILCPQRAYKLGEGIVHAYEMNREPYKADRIRG
jgi:hypothetical protein